MSPLTEGDARSDYQCDGYRGARNKRMLLIMCHVLRVIRPQYSTAAPQADLPPRQEYDLALQDYSKALELNPMDHFALNNKV